MAALPQKTLSVFDSACIIVGIIIGAGIYETAPLVAASMPGGLGTLLIWAITSTSSRPTAPRRVFCSVGHSLLSSAPATSP